MRKRIPITKRGTKGHFIDQKSLTYLLTFILVLLIAALVVLSIPEYKNAVIDWVKGIFNRDQKPPRPRPRIRFRGESLRDKHIAINQSAQDSHHDLNREVSLISTRHYATPNLLTC